MRRVKDDSGDMPAQDSFLDVVTNIVGILILLVLMMGVRTSRAVHEGKLRTEAVQSQSDYSQPSLQKAYHSAEIAERDVRDLMRTTIQIKQEMQLREQEREFLGTLVAAAEQAVNAHRAELDGEQQRDYDMRRRLLAEQIELEKLTREQMSLLSQIPEAEEIECPPTPISKVATGKQIWVQLKDGHVAPIPVEEILELIKSDGSANAWRLKKDETFANRVGPVEGFRVNYRIRRQEVDGGLVGGGTVMTATLVLWELFPVTSPMGEPLAEALLPGSELMQHLLAYPPGGVTVTVFMYPDGFAEYNTLRSKLLELGYSTAANALPEGHRIGFSPHGVRSMVD